MSQWSSQQYLLTRQYNNAQKLQARIYIHEHFSINTYDWHRWVFDHFLQSVREDKKEVLEIGCGPATLWVKNTDRIPTQWQITLTDFSPGMLQEAQSNLRDIPHPFTFAQVDAQSIPFDDAHFDMVIANHMLYHVPDRNKALAEIRRVLKPGGHFFAATNGNNHMRETFDLVIEFDPSLQAALDSASPASPLSFRLDNGRDELARHFSTVQLHIYENGLLVTEAEPLVAYTLSHPVGESIIGNRVEDFTNFLAHKIATDGAIHITKETGMFETMPY